MKHLTKNLILIEQIMAQPFKQCHTCKAMIYPGEKYVLYKGLCYHEGCSITVGICKKCSGFIKADKASNKVKYLTDGQGNMYHTSCPKCSRCYKNLSGKYTVINGKDYCLGCVVMF